ncbi:MAG: cystathionine beta-lyase [Shewanella sp.]
MKKDSKIVCAGRDKHFTQGIVNPPIYRASTVVFDSLEHIHQASLKKADGALFYGRRGTPTQFALQQAIAELEGGAGCALFPSGTAAIAGVLLSFLKAGDHLLMVDSVYEPTRDLCDQLLSGYGISTSYYDPMIGDELASLIQTNTKAVFFESPGSITMEVQDIPKLCQIAHQFHCITLLDNTWASPINCRPFTMRIDISIQSITKYVAGHSDVMMGSATANPKYWRQLQQHSYLLGQCVSADDSYLALRGLRTLSVRLQQQANNALKVANWLALRPEVDHLRHPSFSECPGHDFYERDFSGGNGLFSVVLKPAPSVAIKALVDNMQFFKLGFSWGGFESLLLWIQGIDKIRTAIHWDSSFPLLRLHIGLEDADDLIAD